MPGVSNRRRMAMAEEKKKRHNLYDFVTGGKNNRADVDLRSQIKGFNTKNMFRLYFRRFRQITILNIMIIMSNFQAFLIQIMTLWQVVIMGI